MGVRQPLEDKAYQALLEALFQCAVSEKQAYFSNKKNSKGPAEGRLAKTAEALRVAVNYGASRMKRRHARLIIDHITQTLPGPSNEQYVAPLLQDYVRALVALLSHSANVEQLSAMEEEWLTCADFFVDAIARLLEGADLDAASLFRASPAPGGAFTPTVTFSTGRSSASSTQRSSSQIPSKVLEQVVRGLLALVAAPNVPVHKRSTEITRAVIQVLQLKNISVGGLQQTAFACLGFIISRVQADDLALVGNIARDVMPLVAHWWHPRSSATQSESLNSVREEVLRTLFALQLHVEALAYDPAEVGFLGHVEEVLNALWTEYSKREDRTRLQTGDLTFSNVPTTHFSNKVFGLRPFDISA